MLTPQEAQRIVALPCSDQDALGTEASWAWQAYEVCCRWTDELGPWPLAHAAETLAVYGWSIGLLYGALRSMEERPSTWQVRAAFAAPGVQK
jgi:hypothetical protein